MKLKTYEEYKGQFEERGKFLIIQSEEISDHFGDKPLHLNAHNNLSSMPGEPLANSTNL